MFYLYVLIIGLCMYVLVLPPVDAKEAGIT